MKEKKGCLIMKNLGTVARGIKTPIIQEGDNLVQIVVDSVLTTAKEEGFTLNHKDIIGITEGVVGISLGNYATVDQIASDIKNKYNHADHLGVVFPILSRNRFSILLKSIARATKKITILLSYPKDEVGNNILEEKDLKKYNINPYSDIISESEYENHFSEFKHMYTGVNMIDYYRKICHDEKTEVEFVLSNQVETITDYTSNILVANIHLRKETKAILKDNENLTVYGLDDILTQSVNGSGYNETYGLLGSNTATKEKVKLFPRNYSLVFDIQNELHKITGKKIEVMIYGDGAFKDPSSGVWELADPVVSPSYTDGLEGSPNEVKIKYLADDKYAKLKGEDLKKAIIEEIKNKEKDLVGKDVSLGTTPRKYVDLIGSLCDLISGSGDKGTPIVLIQNYFTNYVD